MYCDKACKSPLPHRKVWNTQIQVRKGKLYNIREITRKKRNFFIEAERKTGKIPCKYCLALPKRLLLVTTGDITSNFKSWLQLDALHPVHNTTNGEFALQHAQITRPTRSPGSDCQHYCKSKKFLTSLTKFLTTPGVNLLVQPHDSYPALKIATNSQCWGKGVRSSKTSFQNFKNAYWIWERFIEANICFYVWLRWSGQSFVINAI